MNIHDELIENKEQLDNLTITELCNTFTANEMIQVMYIFYILGFGLGSFCLISYFLKVNSKLDSQKEYFLVSLPNGILYIYLQIRAFLGIGIAIAAFSGTRCLVGFEEVEEIHYKLQVSVGIEVMFTIPLLIVYIVTMVYNGCTQE